MIVRDQPLRKSDRAIGQAWQRAVLAAWLKHGERRVSTQEVCVEAFPNYERSYTLHQKRSVHVRQLRKAAAFDLIHGEWMGNRWEWWPT